MRLTTSSKGLLLGSALTLMAAGGCGDDDKKNETDAGRDSGMQNPVDSGVDAHVPLEPVNLRLAHLAFGSGIGPIHICAYDADEPEETAWALVTSDALITGDFQHVNALTPIDYGAITRHVQLGESTLNLLGGLEIQIYRAADANAAILDIGANSVAFCHPTVAPLAHATLGTGAGAVTLVPGQSHTIVIAGAAGTEIASDTACTMAPGGACVGPTIVTLTDELSTTSTTEARVRIVLADQRYGATPGVCHNLATAAPQDIAPLRAVTNAAMGLAPFLIGGTPTYENTAPVLPGTGPTPQVITLHLNAGASPTPPCGASAGYPSNGVIPIGAIPNGILIAQYQMQATAGRPVATIRSSLAAGEVSTVFIAPFPTEFGDPTDDWSACDPTDPTMSATCAPKGYVGGDTSMPCQLGATATCLPNATPCNPTVIGCEWIDTAIPAADVAPPTP